MEPADAGALLHQPGPVRTWGWLFGGQGRVVVEAALSWPVAGSAARARSIASLHFNGMVATILLHGLEQMHLAEAVPHAVHDFAQGLAAHSGALSGVVEWLVGALASAIAGIIVGGLIVGVVRQMTRNPEKLIVD